MGYAVIMFVIMLLLAVSIALSANYGISKDSQVAPLKAENAYAEREAGKAQTGLTIVNTCLKGPGRYVNPQDPSSFQTYALNLTVRNNGSIVLNPKNSTIFYNLSYLSFNVSTGNVWAPLTNSTMLSNITITSSDAYSPLRLMIATSNGITAIAPTSPSNFVGQRIKANTTYAFTWTPSIDDTGIAYYILSGFDNPPPGNCPPLLGYTGTYSIEIFSGNLTDGGTNYTTLCGNNCNTAYYFLTAVDTEGNMGIPSVTVKCVPGGGCGGLV